MSKFQVSKSLIEVYVNNGLTVKQMSEDITAKSGEHCSAAFVRHACKTYGINLMTKKRPSPFVLDDLANRVVEETPAYTVAAGTSGSDHPAYVRVEPTVEQEEAVVRL